MAATYNKSIINTSVPLSPYTKKPYIWYVMTILGTPNISFGLGWIEWLIVIDVVVAGIAAYLLFYGFKRRQKRKQRQHEASVSENSSQ